MDVKKHDEIIEGINGQHLKLGKKIKISKRLRRL
mgnify:CR=1 FL=1